MRSTQFLLAAWGVLLPISVQRDLAEGGVPLTARVEPPDVLAALLILVFLIVRFNELLRVVRAWRWLIALCLIAGVSCIGLLLQGGAVGDPIGFAGFFLVVCTGCCISVALRDPRLAAALTIGLCLGATMELIVVVYDFVAWNLGLPQWFIDRMDGRIRGTFRASGQLAQYGISVGLALVMLARTKGLLPERLQGVAALLGVTLFLATPVATSRRSAIIAAAIGVTLYCAVYVAPQLMRIRNLGRVVLVVVVVATALIIGTEEYMTFQNQRLQGGLDALQDADSFFAQQILHGLELAGSAGPLGYGWGSGLQLSPTGHEWHNQFVAVAVDCGWVGLILLSAALIGPAWDGFRKVRRPGGNGTSVPAGLRIMAVTVLVVFGQHNRFLRDRAFAVNYALLIAGMGAVRSGVRKGLDVPHPVSETS